MASKYVIDTSAIIDMHNSYPRSVFSGVWKEFDKLARFSSIVAPRQVSDEVIKSEFLRDWCKAHKAMFVALNWDTWEQACKIMKKHPALINPNRRGQQADPFIIALADTIKSSLASDEPVIITHEEPNESNKIPSVARSFGVKSDNLTGLFEREGWTF